MNLSSNLGFLLGLFFLLIPLANGARTALRKIDDIVGDPNKYDPRLPPMDNVTGISQVKVRLRIRNIWNIDQKSMDCKMNILLGFLWKDDRLANISQNEIRLTNPHIINKMWVPEMFFSNSKEGKFHSIAVPNQMMFIKNDGNLKLVRRYFVHFTCAMDFQDYPFDKQECALEISHIQRTPGDFIWNEDTPLSVHPAVKLPQFVVDVPRMQATECDHGYSIDENTICLKAIIHFRRRLGYFLVNVYIPSIMIVMVSWTSFWMDINSAPGRISLSVTTLLTISTKASSLQSMTAEVSYVKAIDIWMGVCQGCVFFSLVEFVYASYIHRANLKKTATAMKKKNLSQVEADKELVVEIPKWRKANIDYISRFLFPGFFALFNLVYWIYYLI